MTVVGTRPEIIRLSRIISVFDEHTEHTLIHTGQNSNHKLSHVFFDEMGIRTPDVYLGCSTTTLGTFLGCALQGVEDALDRFRPDAFVILGDTNTAFTAVIAKRTGIPVYHLEAGNRSFDPNVPEEVNRKIIDHTADFNMVYSEHARRNLIAEGLHPRHVFLIGSPMREVLNFYSSQIANSQILKELRIRPREFFLLSAHRQENIENPGRLLAFVESLESLYSHWKLPIIMTTHPRTAARLKEINWLPKGDIRILDPFGFFDYVQLQRNSLCVLSDSGTISEESAILGFRAVTIRASMERPEALESAVLPLADLHAESVTSAVQMVLGSRFNPEVPAEYKITNTSWRVLNAVVATSPVHRFWVGLRPK